MEQSLLDQEIRYALAVKLNMLKREGLPDLEYTDLEQAVVHGMWKDQIPSHPSTAVDRILRVKSEDVVTTLTRLALTEGASMDMNDLQDLLGRNDDE